ncbi:MAG: ABC transporter substrate-binding protein [Acidimicrobiales bacterium]
MPPGDLGECENKGEEMLSARRSKLAVTMVAVLGITAAACSNAVPTATTNSSNAPGVSAHEIIVGSLSTQSGPIAADFAPVVPGVKAYLDMINAQGGVDGRKINLKYSLDDASQPTQNVDLARTLVGQDHVFAIVGVASFTFAAAPYLTQQGTPAFGYVVSKDWSPAPNLFGSDGSVLAYPPGAMYAPYLAKKLSIGNVAVLAYNVPASADACSANIKQFQAEGIKVGYQNLATGIEGGTVTSDVLRMKQAGVGLVLSCMDVTGNVALSRALQQNGLGSVRQLWLNGYDRNVLQQYQSLMSGVYLLVQHVPFEAAQQFPGKFPGLDKYIATMNKYEPQYTYNEVALQGWLNADLFVKGLKAVGPNLTQGKLVAAINKMTNFNGDGLIPPVNWKLAHTTTDAVNCGAYVKAGTNKFDIVLNKGHDVFVCFKTGNPTPVAAPSGTPGA